MQLLGEVWSAGACEMNCRLFQCLHKLLAHLIDDSTAARSITLKLFDVSLLDVVEIAARDEYPLRGDDIPISSQPTEGRAERRGLAADDLGKLLRSEPAFVIVPPAGEDLKLGVD